MRQPIGRIWYRGELDLTIMLAKAIAGLASAWPLAALYVKRLHDLSLSGWWTLAVPAIAVVFQMVGTKPGSIFFTATIPPVGFIPGTRGDNHLGLIRLSVRHNRRFLVKPAGQGYCGRIGKI